MMRNAVTVSALLLGLATFAPAGVGDPQVMTDHPWYGGELTCSTFERLFATQAAVYQRETGRQVTTDEDKALASWYWRNLHFAHGQEGAGDCFNLGFARGDWNREYWGGLFAHGFALCGTTHAQYTAEMQYLLGHGRARAVGVTGHNSFEAFITGGPYGEGKWVLLDHDVSTVVYDAAGTRLVGISELMKDLKRLGDPAYQPARQHGWRVSGLHENDARGAFDSFTTVEYFAGYAGPPPRVHLRSGETMRRYLEPGLEDGRTFVFWGRNYNVDGVPGPERSRAWVNQPQNMYEASRDAGHRPGQVRYANAMYTYRPDFRGGGYREGVIGESAEHVTFDFRTPYVIAATPPNDSAWGVYEDGCRNGLVVMSRIPCRVDVSTDRGRTWHTAQLGPNGKADLTDHAKGHQQYWLRIGRGAAELADAALTIRTVCQANVAVLPRLRDGLNTITYQSSGSATVSAGPNLDQAMAHQVAGDLKRGDVTLELAAPRGEKIIGIHAASWNASGNPPPPDVAYGIEYSIDDGATWRPIVSDWRIPRRPPEPKDFWSQSFTYGGIELPEPYPGGGGAPIRVHFTNSGRRSYRKVEAHLTYEVKRTGDVHVTFAWREGGADQLKTHRHTVTADADQWTIPAGQNIKTAWVEFAAP